MHVLDFQSMLNSTIQHALLLIFVSVPYRRSEPKDVSHRDSRITPVPTRVHDAHPFSTYLTPAHDLCVRFFASPWLPPSRAPYEHTPAQHSSDTLNRSRTRSPAERWTP